MEIIFGSLKIMDIFFYLKILGIIQTHLKYQYHIFSRSEKLSKWRDLLQIFFDYNLYFFNDLKKLPKWQIRTKNFVQYHNTTYLHLNFNKKIL